MIDYEIMKVGDGKFAMQVNGKVYEVDFAKRHLPRQKLQKEFERGAFKPIVAEKPAE